MGRAFRVLKRTTHLTVQVSERAEKVVPVGTDAGETPKRRRAGAKKQTPAAKRATKKAKE
jgi:hypothetical protein